MFFFFINQTDHLNNCNYFYFHYYERFSVSKVIMVSLYVFLMVVSYMYWFFFLTMIKSTQIHKMVSHKSRLPTTPTTEKRTTMTTTTEHDCTNTPRFLSQAKRQRLEYTFSFFPQRPRSPSTVYVCRPRTPVGPYVCSTLDLFLPSIPSLSYPLSHSLFPFYPPFSPSVSVTLTESRTYSFYACIFLSFLSLSPFICARLAPATNRGSLSTLLLCRSPNGK